MALEELKNYYYQLRTYEIKNGIKEIKITKRIFSIIRLITKINRLLNHRLIKVLNNQSYRVNEPKIYVSTQSDFATETLVEILPGPFYITSSPKNIISYIERLLLENGILRIPSANDSKDNDNIEHLQVKNLEKGGNELLLTSPDINSSSNINLSNNASKLVLKTGAVIIPIATEDHEEQDKIISIVNIGKNLYIGTVKPEYIDEITKIIRIDLERLREEINQKKYVKK